MAQLIDEQLDRFRLRLLAMSAQLGASLTQTEGDTEPVEPDLAIGRLTRMDAIQMQAVAQQNRRQLEVRGLQVVAALEGLQGGICRPCKGPISLRRLEVLPESPFCLGCEESFEREKK